MSWNDVICTLQWTSMFWTDRHQWDLVINVPIRLTIGAPVFHYTLRTVLGNTLGCEFANTGDYDGFSPTELLQHGGFLLKIGKPGVVGKQGVSDDNILYRQEAGRQSR